MDTRELIDLTGPDGNANFLLMRARKLCKVENLDVDLVQAEMKAGDYDNLLAVMEKYFGKYIRFRRPEFDEPSVFDSPEQKAEVLRY